MARTILVAGTASHVGKSTVAAGLCRALAREGVGVAPFKAQNMSNNARVAVGPDGEYGEIGVSQYVQARAAGVVARVDCNPVLLKPRGDAESQLIIHGHAVGHMKAGDYLGEHWSKARAAARRSHERLAAEHEVIVAEGAGGLGEINLHHRDLANVETARFADADVLLVTDIDRGGAFASLYGTFELMPDDVRQRVVGMVITKFRGDRAILTPGIEELEARTGVPVLGVIPEEDPGLPAEDSVSLPSPDTRAVMYSDQTPGAAAATVGVARLPHISNATDFEPLGRVPGLQVVSLPPTGEFANVDAIILPGTKNTVDDLLALQSQGFGDRLRTYEGPILGLCGGFQMLGEVITGAHREGTGDPERVDGFGLLPVVTHFSGPKEVTRVTRSASGAGPLAGLDGAVSGYEIHMGQTRPVAGRSAGLDRPIGPESAAVGSVLGTYLHGIFENRNAREAFVRSVFQSAGVDPPPETDVRRSPSDRAAALIARHLDTTFIGFDLSSTGKRGSYLRGSRDAD